MGKSQKYAVNAVHSKSGAVQELVEKLLKVDHYQAHVCYIMHNESREYISIQDYTTLTTAPLMVENNADYVFHCIRAVYYMDRVPYTIMAIRQKIPNSKTHAYLMGNTTTKTIDLERKEEILRSLKSNKTEKVVDSENFPVIFYREEFGNNTSAFRLLNINGSDSEQLYMVVNNGRFTLKEISGHPQDAVNKDTHFIIEAVESPTPPPRRGRSTRNHRQSIFKCCISQS